VSGRRWILVGTGVAVTLAALAFALAGWSRLGAVAAVIGALAAVAGVGITAWAAVGRPATGPRRIEVDGSGSVRGVRGSATTGAVIRDGSSPDEVVVRRTGDIDGARDGTTGYQGGR
jgi:hypothetical protein